MSYNCTPDKPLRWAKNCNFSDLLHRQARDAVKIPQIAGHDCIAEFQSAGTDQKVGQRQIDSLGGPFPANAGCDFCRRFGYGLNRDGGFQLVEESAAAVAKLLRIGTVDAVADSATLMALSTIGISPIACITPSTAWAAVRFRRSAAMRTLESRTNPKRAGSMAGAGL